MEPSTAFPEQIISLLRAWAVGLSGLDGDLKKINFLNEQYSRLLDNREFFYDILEKISMGSLYPDIRRSGLFENEIILYMHPGSLFSIRLAFYEPGEYTLIHDHSSWGIFGTLFGSLEVIKYRRRDHEAEKKSAQLIETKRLEMQPGKTDFTLPLNEGIHSIGNPTDNLIATVSIYGKPLRRLFINTFDPEKNEIQPIYPPRLKKKMQAKHALMHFYET